MENGNPIQIGETRIPRFDLKPECNR